MDKNLLFSVLSVSFFIVCPRMAGMVQIISKHSQVPLIPTTILGTIFAIPLVVLMVLIFDRFGLMLSLAFCVLTDFGAAFLMKNINVKAGMETFIVAFFVIAGVRTAPYIINFLEKLF